MSDVQTSVFGGKTGLSELSAAVRLESQIVEEFYFFNFGDDSAARSFVVTVDLFVRRNIRALSFENKF